MNRAWKILEVHARKSLCCCGGTFKGNSGEGSEEEERSGESLSLLREYSSSYEHNVGRDMNGKGHFDEVLDGNGDMLLDKRTSYGTWRKGYSCFNMEKKEKRRKKLGCIVFVSRCFVEGNLGAMQWDFWLKACLSQVLKG